MKLFHSPGSCSLAARIALEEAGAEYETVRVDLAGGEQRKPEYLKINPKGRVPALATDQGVLTENIAILAYIAQAYPKANLAPADAFGFAKVQAFNSYMSSTVHVNHAHKARGTRWADDPGALEAMKKKVPETMAAAFELIEKEMLQGPWVLGEQFSTADAYLYALARWLEGDGVDVSKFPKVQAHMKRMAERPAVQKALA